MSTLIVVRFPELINLTTEPFIWTIAKVDLLLESENFINIFSRAGLG